MSAFPLSANIRQATQIRQCIERENRNKTNRMDIARDMFEEPIKIFKDFTQSLHKADAFNTIDVFKINLVTVEVEGQNKIKMFRN
uniref:Uncharacterized protein n=1 Tax=Rhabditophanes sp. KR3021 TaxID=114890 RepID=A0AC35TQM2_9BILA